MSKLKDLNKKILGLEASIQKKTDKLNDLRVKQAALLKAKSASKVKRKSPAKVSLIEEIPIPKPSAAQAAAAANAHQGKVKAAAPSVSKAG